LKTRLAPLVVALALLVLVPACAKKEASSLPFKVGIVTGTVSQGEDEYRAAEKLKKKFPGSVVHRTYPDNFMQEQDTTISQIVGLAADPKVKVIILGQAIPGSVPAVRKVRETRTDILFGFVEPHEDPPMVDATADISIQPNQRARGRTIVDAAHRMGAKVFVHYSFPRHMSMQLLAERANLMEERCKELGIEFARISAPDPMSEGGLPATQQFVLEDVPRQVGKFGADVAFFSTNCGMQDPLIKAVLEEGAIFSEPCCPSPTHGFPTALGIRIPAEHAGDFAYINEQNRMAIHEHGMKGRFTTWPASGVIVGIDAVSDLLIDSVLGKADHKDPATVKAYLEKAAGTGVEIAKYDEDAGNYYLMLIEQITY
jgi:hypothetical protein